MARRTGSADTMEAAAQSRANTTAQQQIRAGRSVDTAEQAALARMGSPTIGSPNYRPTLAEQLAAVPASFWASGGQQGGGGGQQTTAPAPAAETPATFTPPSREGGGAAPAATASNVDTLSKMYADALAELQRQYGMSQKNIMESIGRMKADPYNTANAYAAMQILNPQVAANPVAEYMAAAGMSPGQAQAAQAMAQAEADAYRQAMQNVQNVMSTSQQQANLSRLADIGLIETGATQDLESNLNMLRLGLEKERIGAVSGQQQRNLENQLTMRNAISKQISDIFSGQNVAPESILKLIEAALAKMNTSQWSTIPGMRGRYDIRRDAGISSDARLSGLWYSDWD